jgi:VCBS repeat-containing protein
MAGLYGEEPGGDIGQDDSFTTDEDTAVSGNVLANDSDPDNDALMVTAINGSAAEIGTPITLASGAQLTLNGDGQFDYDPNGQFEALNAGESDTDSFTYTVSDGTTSGTATVTLTVTGVDAVPLVNGQPATLFVDSSNTVVGNGYQSGQLYAGSLFSNTDLSVDASNNPDDVVRGTAGDDNIWTGREGQDTIEAGAGNDLIGYGAGDARVFAGDGDDRVYGINPSATASHVIDLGWGNDFTTTQAGNHTVLSAGGNNTVGVGAGTGQVSLGDGDDFVYSLAGLSGTYTLMLGDGDNRTWLLSGDYTITSGSGNDRIGLGDGEDTVVAEAGNNVIYMVDASGSDDGSKDILTGDGNDWVKTGSGDDRIDLGVAAGTSAADFDVAFGQGGRDVFVLNLGNRWLSVGDFVQGEDRLDVSQLGAGPASLGFRANLERNSTWIWDNATGDVIAELQNFTAPLTEDDFVGAAAV